MDALAEVLGNSPAIVRLREQVRRILKTAGIARRPAPILIHGETGTGKGLIAHIVQRASPRASGPFVDVNCAAIPEHLLEAELFGYERGAFTDARHAKPGLFQLAHRGTLFLDEIGLLPEPLQAKLLKVLDDGAVRRLGATMAEMADVWIVAATNEDLDAARRAHRLREDLYHRLAVLTIDVPALRTRGDDVIQLAEHFLARTCADYGLASRTLALDARAALLAYPWPGNVRELSNVLERAALLSDMPVITAATLALPVPDRDVNVGAPAAPEGSSRELRSSRDRMRAHLLEVLIDTGWNITRTAAILDIARNTVTARIARFGLTRGDRAGQTPPGVSLVGRRRRRDGTASRRSSPTSSSVSRLTGFPVLVTPTADDAIVHSRWERRTVALLRADLGVDSGHGEAPQTSRFPDLVIAKVRSFGGRVEELGLATVLAVFGVDPIEDAPARASLAALAILKAAQHNRTAGTLTSAVRLAVHVHQVMVSHGVAVARIDVDSKQAACGSLDALIRHGERDTILVSDAAVPLLERRFALEPVGATSDERGRAYRLVRRESTGFGLAGRPLTPFVGRERELSTLIDRMADVEAGRGQVVGILGDPGVGKSRVVLELTRLDATRRWQVLSVGGFSHGTATPFLVISELLRRAFRIEDTDNPAQMDAKVAATIRSRYLESEVDLRPLLALLDMPVDDASWDRLDGPQRHRRTLEAVKHLVLLESRRQPLLLVIEDLHWIDTETQAVLDTLVESLPAARVLLVVNYRPEYWHGWSSKTYYSQLRIDPLSPDGADTILRWLLGSDASLEPVMRRLPEQAGGNPFFLEEIIRALVETRALVGEQGAYRLTRALDTIQVPSSVEAVLTTRIERLTADGKELLRWAAVIGTHVPSALLRAVVAWPEERLQRGLGRLRAAEFLYETRVGPDPAYTFKHALTHSVAYERLMPARRRILHARVVEAIELTYRDRLAEQFERLAYHALRGELPEKAVHYLRQAGGKALARSALVDARVCFEQALGVLEAQPGNRSTLEQAFDVRLELRGVLRLLGEVPRLLERLREAEAIAERLGDDHRRGRVCAIMTSVHALLGNLDEALATGTRALTLAQAVGDLKLRIDATDSLAQAHYFRGDYQRVVALASDNLAAVPADWTDDPLESSPWLGIFDHCRLVMSFAQLGRFAEAATQEALAIRLAEPTQHAFTLGLAHWAAATLHLLKGDYVEARSATERWIVILRMGNVALHLPTAIATSAWVLAQLGDASDARNRLRESEQLVEHQAAEGIVGYLGSAYHALGRTCLLLGRLDEARTLGNRAVEFSPTQPGNAAHALHLLGDIATHPDRFDAESGEAHYRKSLTFAEPRGMRPLVAHCHLGLGNLYRRTADDRKAEEHLAMASSMYREMDMGFWLLKAEAEPRGPLEHSR